MPIYTAVFQTVGENRIDCLYIISIRFIEKYDTKNKCCNKEQKNEFIVK